MAIQENPYLPPSARVEDAEIVRGDFIDGGRSVPSGHGWEWIASGWATFKRQPGAWILITIVFGVIFIAASLIPFVSIGAPILMAILVGGIMLGCARLERAEDIGLADLFSGFQKAGGELAIVGLIGLGLSLAASIPLFVMMFMVFSGVMSGAGFSGTAFMIAVLIALGLSVPVYMALWFAAPLVALQGLRPGQAIAQSFRGCLRNFVPFLVYGVVAMVLAFAASIPIFLGWLVLTPVLLASIYAAYRDIYFEG